MTVITIPDPLLRTYAQVINGRFTQLTILPIAFVIVSKGLPTRCVQRSLSNLGSRMNGCATNLGL